MGPLFGLSTPESHRPLFWDSRIEVAPCLLRLATGVLGRTIDGHGKPLASGRTEAEPFGHVDYAGAEVFWSLHGGDGE